MHRSAYISDIPLGEWFTVEEDSVIFALGKTPKSNVARLHRTLSMDKNTLRGRINIAMKKLKTMYPDKQIVLLTPIHRSDAYFGPKNIQPDESFPNAHGLYLDDYVEAVREGGRIWSAPVIDLFAEGGLCPRIENQGRLFWNAKSDRLHPSSEGHRRLALLIAAKLRTLPATFKIGK